MASYYHGSTKFFTSLQPNSWVTLFQDDARFFATPLAAKENVMLEGRPVPNLLAEELPADSQIFIYKIYTTDVTPIDGLNGSRPNWLLQTNDWTKVELVEYYASWHKALGLIPKNISEKVENIFEFSKTA